MKIAEKAGSSEQPQKSKPRVLLVSSIGFLGGAERSLLELAMALSADSNCELSLACPSGPLTEAAIHENISVHPLPDLCHPIRKRPFLMLWRIALAQIALFLHVRRCRPDLVHANGLRALMLSLPLARLLRKPCVWHVRDVPGTFPVVGRLMPRPDALIAPSRFIADRLIEARPAWRGRVHMIPNGVADPKPSPSAIKQVSEELKLPSRSKLVVMVAQMVPWKRHDLFLQAAANVAAEDPAVYFVLVGSDPWSSRGEYTLRLIQRAQEPDLHGRVTFLGQRDDAAIIIAASDVLVLPSDNEPFGRVVVEAWWLETPVIVADNAGPAELVGDGGSGLRFRSGNAESLADAIKETLRNRSLALRLAREGRRSARLYQPAIHAAAVQRVYDTLVVPEYSSLLPGKDS